MCKTLHFQIALLTLLTTVALRDIGAAQTNIVWIIADDLSPDLACYGREHVKTPHLDQLAAEGVRYTRAFATAPVCSSSRTAFITGMYQTTIGGHPHRTHNLPKLPVDIEPVTELFRRAGYYVSNMSSPVKGGWGKQDYNFQFDKLYDGKDWSKRKPGQPFFAQVQIFQPHRDFKKDDNPTRWQAIELGPLDPEHPIIRKDWANYLKSIEVLDEQVGMVLKRLVDEGLSDNTAVFFFGDHGRPHLWGKQWLYDAGIQVPLLVRWPKHLEAGAIDERMVSLIDVAPTSLAIAGIQIPDVMQGRDFLSNSFAGREIIFAARDRCGDAIDRIRCIRTLNLKYIRNFESQRPYMQLSGYKKMQYPAYTLYKVLHQENKLTPEQARFMADTKPEEELYDLAKDPFELHNLVDDPYYAADLARLRVSLETTLRETNDLGDLPEGDADFMAKLMQSKSDEYQKRMQSRQLDPEISDADYLNWWRGELGLPSQEICR